MCVEVVANTMFHSQNNIFPHLAKTTHDRPLQENKAMRLFVLLGLGTLDLGGTGEGLHAVLALLACDMGQY